MSTFDKIMITLALVFMLIFAYGFWDIAQGTNNRFILVKIWLVGFMCAVIYGIWFLT